MLTIDPKEIPHHALHAYLQEAIIPRPIAFVSSMDADGNVNLSPFSFFNVFGTNPPILIFSPSRRGRDNTTKHTYENVLEVPEVVVHIGNFAMVQQMSLASSEYPKGTNEFVKAGFTSVPSVNVNPPRVAEAPVAFECKVRQVIPTGENGGAGNLVICEVVLMHISEAVLNEAGRIDPFKLDAVARLGGDWYARVTGDAIFAVPKPLLKTGIGIDQLPAKIRNSKVLTGNDLGMLGNVEQLPDTFAVNDVLLIEEVTIARTQGEEALHRLAQKYLVSGKIEEAWKILMA